MRQPSRRPEIIRELRAFVRWLNWKYEQKEATNEH
jgi:hypothetical protein